jgi:arylsulfatase
VKERLLTGWQVGGNTYKVHLDGYNQLAYLTGQRDHSERAGFMYFDDDGHLVAVRAENWKFVFCEQKTPGTLDIWGEPLSCRRLPKLYNLRMDPYERADITSNTYYDWTIRRAFLMEGAQAIAGQFIATFKEFPPRQRPQSFNLDQVMEQLQAPKSD